MQEIINHFGGLYHEIFCTASLWDVIQSILINTETLGKKAEILSLSNIASGTYYLTLKTPTWQDTQIIKVLK